MSFAYLNLIIISLLTAEITLARSSDYLDPQKIAAEKLRIERIQRHDYLKDKTTYDLAKLALENVFNDQVKKADDRYYWAGEFTTQIDSTPIPSIAGVGKFIGQDEEASGFTTASVLNILSQTYFDFPELQNTPIFQQIPIVVSAGVNTFSRYKNGTSYNFYPAREIKGIKVRQPVAMKLAPWWKGFTNIPNDADSSSVIQTAKIYHARMFNIPLDKSQELSLFEEFSAYTDQARKGMYYNRFEGRQNTGAFLTWLMDENNPNMPRFYFSDSTQGPRIPFNVNDIDCIVNANVLKSLAAAKKSNLISSEQTIVGYDKTCDMLNDMIAKDEHQSCGIYYPNTMNLSFAIALAEKSGEKCITKNSHNLMIQKILALQKDDGSWKNKGNFWKDKVITTAFAMYSLQHFSDTKSEDIKIALTKGLRYLLSTIQLKNENYEWPANNFFTATAVARSLVMWQSKAYTQAIIASVLLKYSQDYPELVSISQHITEESL